MVDFPDPEAPTSATHVPGSMVRETLVRAGVVGRSG